MRILNVSIDLDLDALAAVNSLEDTLKVALTGGVVGNITSHVQDIIFSGNDDTRLKEIHDLNGYKIGEMMLQIQEG